MGSCTDPIGDPMTDAEKISELRDALRAAMAQWAGWADEARGSHPTGMDMAESDDWMRCEAILEATAETAPPP
jgi:hypothetical protein